MFNFDSLTVSYLKDLCKEIGISVGDSARKPEYVEALEAFFQGENVNGALMALKRDNLQKIAARLSIQPRNGTRQELTDAILAKVSVDESKFFTALKKIDFRSWKTWAILGAAVLLLVILLLGVNFPKAKVASPDLTGYAKVSDLSGYAKKSDIPDLSGYATKAELEGYIKEGDLEDQSLTDNTEKVSEAAEETEVGNPFKIFDPVSNWDWDKLAEQEIPTFQKFLEDHGLTAEDIQEYEPPQASWEPAIYVVELVPELYGNKNIPLLEGYIYTAALSDGTVIDFWGGDPNIKEVQLQWGFTARWVNPYLDLPYVWLDPADPTEFVVRENRFGRYRRNVDSGLPGIPYFDRFGPYQTLPGNVLDWDPPSLDAVAPKNYMDAAAMLGGLAVESEWETDGINWKWVYSGKVAGSGDYCPSGMPCWQTTYVPPQSTGYIELWNGELGAPSKFFANQLAELLSGRFNVDEFSYHPYGD
jgi:hypothetical protein